MMHQLVASSAYGLESVVRWELQQLGIDSRITSPGRIEFAGDDRILGLANLWLRVADRISMRIDSFPSPDFDALFESTKQIAWDQWIPQDGQILVDAKTHKSQLTSVPAIQRTVKKALVDSLQQRYRTTTLSESGAVYHVTVWLQNDQAVLLLDTSGAGLRHRGYRERTKWSVMPETLAAGLILLSVWNADRPLLDPFAGQGIIPIEAALIGQNIAPGCQRSFAFEAWPFYDHRTWQDVKAEASQASKRPLSHRLIGLDSNANVIRQAQQHALAAGVQDAVHFQCQTYDSLQSSREFGCVITHPEYKTPATAEQRELYGSLPDVLRRLPTWSHFILTSHPSFERVVQKNATRRRKLYNGRTECTYYQYLGPKPAALIAESNSDTTVSPNKTSTERTSEPAAKPVFGGLPEKANEQAELFAARLRKRAKHLRRWPGRGVHCYRIYDRDVPEIPLVVDRYEDALALDRI
ncbi:MAG: class I SAM-dependent RNA methyltransferase [Pirellulaceae bacterium]